MIKKYPLIALICITTILSGCATTPDGSRPLLTKEGLCLLTMTGAGAGLGRIAKKDEAAVIGGAAVGALVGYFLCPEKKAEKVAEKSVGDADGDGVNDDRDNCPGTPRGTRVDAAGCPLDSDGDGVTDDKDQCPGTPRGTPVNASGCPLDSDGDGVLDGADKCPNTPRGQKVNAEGCHVIFSLEGVNFAYDSAALTSGATSKLNEGVAMLKANADIKVMIEGHTDSRGSDEYNMSLSQRRAESVVNFLTSNGIAASRLSSAGRGEGSPVASNDTDEGRAQNRRVDFVIQ